MLFLTFHLLVTVSQIISFKLQYGYAFQTLVSSYEHEIAIKSPVSLAVFEDILYFCDNHTREIWSVDSVTGKPKTWLHDRAEPVLKAAAVSHLVALHVYHPVMQTHAEGLLIKTGLV